MEKFTASEVRYALHETTCPVSAKLVEIIYAYADRLEAQERAVPVGTILTREPDEGYARIQWADDFHFPEDTKLYTHPAPADADRLAEALHNLVSEWVAIADDGDATLEDSTIGYRACANRLSAMLAAHTAQAQPPAASVPNGLIDALRHQLQIDECGDEVGVSRQAVDEAIAILTMLAAQENPNG